MIHARKACRRRGLGALALLMVTGGCLEVQTVTTLRLDGSGTFHQTTSIHMAKARAFLEMLRAEGRQREGEEGHPLPLVDLDPAKQLAALRAQAGITEVEATTTDDDGAQVHGTTLGLRFARLGALLESGALEHVEPTLERTKEGAWRLTLRSTLLDADDLPKDGAAATELAALRRKLLERFQPYWKDLAVVTSITLPTRVLATNGQVDASERTVTWRVGFADLGDPPKLTQTVTFADAEDLKLEPFPRKP